MLSLEALQVAVAALCVTPLKVGVPGTLGGVASSVVNDPVPLAPLKLPAASRARTATV
jgi:hypothetical protein